MAGWFDGYKDGWIKKLKDGDKEGLMDTNMDKYKDG